MLLALVLQVAQVLQVALQVVQVALAQLEQVAQAALAQVSVAVLVQVSVAQVPAQVPEPQALRVPVALVALQRNTAVSTPSRITAKKATPTRVKVEVLSA